MVRDLKSKHSAPVEIRYSVNIPLKKSFGPDSEGQVEPIGHYGGIRAVRALLSNRMTLSVLPWGFGTYLQVQS